MLSSGFQEGMTPTCEYHQSPVRDHPVFVQLDSALGSLLDHAFKHDHGVLVCLTGCLLLTKPRKAICCHLLPRLIRHADYLLAG